MDGGKEQEKQPITPSAFHVGESSATKTFEELLPGGIPNRDKFDKEKKVLKNTNPNLADFIEEDLGLDEGGYPVKDATQRYDGYLIGHLALRLQAEKRGGVLPKFSKEGFEDYLEDEEEKLINESDAGEYSNRDEGGLKVRKSRLTTFRKSEPDFSKAVERNLGAIQDWKPEDDPRYQAIIDLSLAVGLGSKAPRNVQQ